MKTSSQSNLPLTLLKSMAVITALFALLQTALGVVILSGTRIESHRSIGMATMLAAILASLAAVVWQGRSGNKGLMMHALGVALIGIIQFGLGEMGAREIHTGLGALFLIAALALATLAFRKPGQLRDAARG